MATVAWPSSRLPAAALRSGYMVSAESGIVRTPMETGLARQRKRFSTPPSRVRLAWYMDGAQLAFFKSWLIWKAASGGAWFSIELKLDEVPRVVDARFVGDPSYALATKRGWRVEAEVEVKVAPPLSSDVVDIIAEIGDDALAAIVASLDDVTLAPAFAAWDVGFGM